jgi:hypothetical protein
MAAQSVEMLILGAGWSSSFLMPLCEKRGITCAGTTRDGRDGTIPFVYDPEHADREQYKRLPDAKTVLISFPITSGAADMVDAYLSTRSSEGDEAQFIQLGTTSVWDVSLSFVPDLLLVLPNYLLRATDMPKVLHRSLQRFTRTSGTTESHPTTLHRGQTRKMLCYHCHPAIRPRSFILQGYGEVRVHRRIGRQG